MYSTRSSKVIGLLYLAPALLFVLVFTAYPLAQMIWMSFHNWSIIEPARWVGVANYVRAYNDNQFWVSLGFTLKYTLYLTHRAPRFAEFAPPKVHPCRRVRAGGNRA